MLPTRILEWKTQAITRVGGIIGAYAFPVLLSAVGQRATIGKDVEVAPPVLVAPPA